MKNITKTLLFILGLSFLLRIIHITYDLPIMSIADERSAGMYGALNMLSNLSFYLPLGSDVRYPGLTTYVQLPFIIVELLIMFVKLGSVEAAKEAVIMGYGWQLIIAERLASIFTGMITLVFVFKIARKIIGKYWALLAVLLLSVNLLFFIETTFGRPWGICTMFATISVYYLLNRKSKKMGLFSGLAYGANQGGAFLFAVLFLIDFFRNKKKAIYSILTFLIPVVVISLLHIGGVYYNLSLFDDTVTGDNLSYFGLTVFERFSFYPFVLLRCCPIELLIVGVYFLMGGWKNKEARILLAVCVGYYLMIGPIFGTSISRYLMPILPAFVILVAIGLKSFLQKFKYKTVLIVLFVLYAGFNTFFWNIAMMKDSTPIQVREWVINNVDQDEWIIVETDKGSDLALFPSQKTLDLKKQTDYYLAVEKLIDGYYSDHYDPQGKYNYINLNEYSDEVVIELNNTYDFEGVLIVPNEKLEGTEPIISFYAVDADSNYVPIYTNHIFDNKDYTNIPFFYLPTIFRSGPDFHIYSLGDVVLSDVFGELN